MVLAVLAPLSVAGGLFVGGLYQRKRQASPLITKLRRSSPLSSRLNFSVFPSSTLSSQTEKTVTHLSQDDAQQLPIAFLSTNQHLALSAGLLGGTVVSHVGFPLLRLFCLPGLLYLDFYFVGLALSRWRVTKQVGIETNDAILVTGLLATRQLAAQALFAGFFFTSEKLQELTAQEVILQTAELSETASPAEQLPSASTMLAEADKAKAWQQQIDRGALPLLVLSAVSTPLLGFQRSLSVLLANFGYDYRVFAPLSQLGYFKLAKGQEIWLRNINVLEKLAEADVVVIDCQLASMRIAEELRKQEYVRTVYCVDEQSTSIAPQIAAWQAEGRHVIYIGTTVEDRAALTQADIVVLYTAQSFPPDEMQGFADGILQLDRPEQLHQLFTLATHQRTNHQRSLFFAMMPSLVNLYGIYFGGFNVITVLLIDYGGMGLGLINSLLPQLSATQSSQLPK